MKLVLEYRTSLKVNESSRLRIKNSSAYPNVFVLPGILLNVHFVSSFSFSFGPFVDGSIEADKDSDDNT